MTGHSGDPDLKAESPVLWVDAAPTPLLSGEAAEQGQHLPSPAAKRCQGFMRVVSVVLPVFSPTLGIEREGDVSPDAPARGFRRWCAGNKDQGVVRGQHQVKPDDAKLLDVAEVADHVVRGPARPARPLMQCSVGLSANGDR